MKRAWLRGMLLGVSMALVLAGGVALAQGLTVTVDKHCVNCYPGSGNFDQSYMQGYRISGVDVAYKLCQRMTLDGERLFRFCGTPTGPEFFGTYGFSCGGNQATEFRTPGGEVQLAGVAGGTVGQGNLRVWQPDTGDSASVSWRVAEDCSALEFVPEPGSMLLLGSGLAGLAGYATLRLRSGQARRWRARE